MNRKSMEELMEEMMEDEYEKQFSKPKVYLAGGISDKPRKEYQTKVAKKLEDIGYEVYSASTNDSINDKSNDPTPEDIYNADVWEILTSDYFIQTISGAGEDGTNYESGIVAGVNETVRKYNYIIDNVVGMLERGSIEQAIEVLKSSKGKTIGVLGFLTNERLVQPQLHHNIPSAGFNHLILGGIDKWGVLEKNEEDMLNVMKMVLAIRELDDESISFIEWFNEILGED